MAGAKAERLANLVTYLLDVEQPVALRTIVEQVAGYPEASPSARTQFLRDRDDLRNEGVVIELTTVGNDDRYRIDPDAYHLPDLGLTEAEVLALKLAAESVRLEGEDPDEALLKLGTLGADTPAIVALPSDRRLGGIYEAVRRRSLLRFRYDGVDRVLEPWGVLCRDGFWYAHGLDRTRGEQRTFRVDRIDGDVAVDAERDAFEPPAGFDPHRDIPSLPFERTDDGGVVVLLPVRNVAGLRSWLFGMLDHARVVGPPAMVDSVRSWLTAIAEAR